MSNPAPSSGTNTLDPEFAEIVSLVYDRTGLVFPPNRIVIVQAGIRRAMSAAGISDTETYAELLRHSAPLLDDLFAELTVGETYFFRDPSQLQVIRHDVLPDLREHVRVPNGIRVWSAGCATGEEPYTLAMLLSEEDFAYNAYVIGTDLSRDRLRVAQRGTYRSWSMRGVEENVISRYFTKRRDQFDLKPTIRNMVEFRYLNLGLDNYPSPALGVWGMDLILCRNVLIYFDTETVAKVARNLLASLSAHGWLFLGASDPMLTELVDCEVLTTSSGLAYRRGTAGAPRRLRRMLVDESPSIGVRHVLETAPDIWNTNRATTSESTPSIEFPELSAHSDTLSNVATPLLDDPAEVTVSLDDLYSKRDYGAVTEKAERELKVTPNNERAWILLIRSHANLGQLAEAERACAAGLDRLGTSAELWYLHAILLAEAGCHLESAQAARRAIYLDRQLAVAHLALGTALRKVGDSGARLAFSNALRILEQLPPGTVVPASDGESSERITMAARVQLNLSAETA